MSLSLLEGLGWQGSPGVTLETALRVERGLIISLCHQGLAGPVAPQLSLEEVFVELVEAVTLGADGLAECLCRSPSLAHFSQFADGGDDLSQEAPVWASRIQLKLKAGKIRFRHHPTEVRLLTRLSSHTPVPPWATVPHLQGGGSGYVAEHYSDIKRDKVLTLSRSGHRA